MDAGTKTMLTVGERCRIARERAGVGVQEMADRIGKHRTRVTAYESATHLDSGLLATYAAVLGNVTAEWLAFEIGDPPARATEGLRAPLNVAA